MKYPHTRPAGAIQVTIDTPCVFKEKAINA